MAKCSSRGGQLQSLEIGILVGVSEVKGLEGEYVVEAALMERT